jgi:hypothetical protein
MNKDIFKSAVNDIKTDKELVDRTVELLMRTPENKPSHTINKHYIKYLPIAVCIFLLVSLPLFKKGTWNTLLPNSATGDAVVRVINNPSHINRELAKPELVYLTEEQILDGSEVIVYAEVVNLEHISISFGNYKDYRTLVYLKVLESYKGEVKKEETIKFLAPALLDGSIWTEDTGTISQLTKGDEGFFLLNRYDESAYWEQNGSRLILADVADFGMGDGERFVLINRNDKFIFANWAFESLSQASSHEDIEKFILSHVK